MNPLEALLENSDNGHLLLQMMQTLMDVELAKANHSGWKYDSSSPWSNIATFDKLSRLPRPAQKLGKIELLREMIMQNYNFSSFKEMLRKEAMAHKEDEIRDPRDHRGGAHRESPDADDSRPPKTKPPETKPRGADDSPTKPPEEPWEHEPKKCKLNAFGQLQHMVEGNRWSSVNVPWLRLVLFDVLELLPNYDDDLDQEVQKIMSEFEWLFSTEKLTNCGWELVDAQCMTEEKNEKGHRYLKKCRNENVLKNPLGYSRDKVMLLKNYQGTENNLFPPGVCVMVTHYLNDFVEMERYNDVEGDVKKWKEKHEKAKRKGGEHRRRRTKKLAYWQTKSWTSMKSEGSRLKHWVFSAAWKEYRTVKKSRPFRTLKNMMKTGDCSSVVFTGFSLGGTIAELARIDMGLANEDKLYTDKCRGGPRYGDKSGVPCKVIAMASTAAWPGSSAPKLAKSDNTCREGVVDPNMGDTMVFLEGDQEPIRLNAYHFGYDIYPKNYSLTTPDISDLNKAWPDEPKGYTNIQGISIVELRRDLVVHFKDGLPKAESCVYSNVAKCDESIWDYFNSKSFTKRLNKIRKPIEGAPDGLFYSCLGDATNRFCGHRILAFDYWEYFHPENDEECGTNGAGELKLPLAEGTRLQSAWNAFQIIKGILTPNSRKLKL